ncbi:MAG: BlaI/MecI/CopY family transcriptional regulator [Fuerstiella sp.]
MARPTSGYPTELELQILNLLWKKSPQTVREVRDALAENGRDLAHTSVITSLGTMVEKGQLEKLPPAIGKAFRFAPLLEQSRVSQDMLGDLVSRVFDGSPETLMLNLFDAHDLDATEIKRLQKLLNRKLKEQRS